MGMDLFIYPIFQEGDIFRSKAGPLNMEQTNSNMYIYTSMHGIAKIMDNNVVSDKIKV